MIPIDNFYINIMTKDTIRKLTKDKEEQKQMEIFTRAKEIKKLKYTITRLESNIEYLKGTIIALSNDLHNTEWKLKEREIQVKGLNKALRMLKAVDENEAE